ncbi:hypothetical protein HanPSC8_Chr13g0593071 [Helianthus annuus]|nr:hypothetical protein HanPSC8_Chr13g0593071 [Helianthus annuus]
MSNAKASKALNHILFYLTYTIHLQCFSKCFNVLHLCDNPLKTRYWRLGHYWTSTHGVRRDYVIRARGAHLGLY